MKAAGILILVIAMSIAGNGFALRLKKRLHSLESIIRLIESLEDKIREFNIPAREFFKSYRSQKSLDEFCESAYTEGLANAVKLHAYELALEESDVHLLCEFAESLGTLSAFEEEKQCRYFREKLEKERRELFEKLPVKAGLFRSAGVMCGILVAVMII